MRISNFTGTLDTTKEVFNTVDGEVFYKTMLFINGHGTPLVASEYILKEYCGKRVDVTGYIRTCDVDGHMFTCIFASNMAEAEQGSADVSVVRFTGKIWSVKDFFILPNCQESLPLVVRYPAPDRQSCVVHVSTVGPIARRLHGTSVTKGTDVVVEGYIRPRGAVVEIVATKCDVNGGEKDAG